MQGEHLLYDDANMWADRIGAGGITHTEWKNLKTRRERAGERLTKLDTSHTQGFFHLPYERGTVTEVKAHVARLKQKGIRHIIVVGIGGSNLGSCALWQSLGNPRKGGMWLTFLDNPDPGVLSEYTGKQDWWKHTAINVISKSGTTLETISIFLFLREALQKSVGVKDHARHVIVTTETNGNPLHEMAKQKGYDVLAHPENVGGRFSVISTVGLFPAD